MFNFPPFFKAVGHPVRQKILNILQREKELSVKELVERLHLSQSTVSHHLGILRNAEVVKTREQGTQTFYRVCCKTVVKCCLKMQKFMKK